MSSTNNLDYLKKTVCDQVMGFTHREMYELLVGDNPFRILLCEKCRKEFGECPENLNGDKICRIRFKNWCQSNSIAEKKITANK